MSTIGRALLLAWLLLGIALNGPATAFSFFGPGVSWPGASTIFHVGITGPSGSAAPSGVTWDTAFADAASRWNQATGFTFSIVDGSSADPCNQSDRRNGVGFAADACGVAFGASTLAITFNQWFLAGNELFESDIVVRNDENWDVYTGPWDSDRPEFSRVVAHELGHALGLGHEETLSALMRPVVFDVESPRADDISGVTAVYGVPATAVVAAVLPVSRSVQVGSTATAFATIVNTGAAVATDCSIAPPPGVAATFFYQITDSGTNSIIGSPNVPVNIPGAAGAAANLQTFVFGFTPTSSFDPVEAALIFDCGNSAKAATTVGLNTLLLSASTTPVPDLIALVAIAESDAIVRIDPTTSFGAFAVASVNVGASASILISADAPVGVPVNLSLCETNAEGACSNGSAPEPGPLTRTIATNATPTFAIFVQGTGTVPIDPANNRVFVNFRDTSGVNRGSTSAAITTN